MKSLRALPVSGTLALFCTLLVAPAVVLAQSAAPKIGSSLIGKLEGPEIILDAKNYPKTFKEAPTLTEQVKAGKLPSVDKRLPEPSQLFVVKPLREIGKYGGNWRRAFTGPADYENGGRIVSLDKILTFDYTGSKIIPSLARDWKVSDDGKTTTIYLRKGSKWSDGKPFTADDFMFWYNDIYLNKNINPNPFFEFQINGKDGVMKKIDDYTVAFEFPEPYPFFVSQLAGSTAIGAGFATRGGFQNFGGAYAPAHYLKQFLPKYSSEEAATKRAKDLGFDSWVSLLKNRYSWALNNELPVMTPWKTVSPINTPTWSMERNPYFWAVGHCGESAAVHRQDHDDAGRERGSRQPARYRRRIRCPGTAHGPRQAARLPRERQEGQLHRPFGPRPQRIGRYDSHRQFLRGRPRDREIPEEQGFPPRAFARHRPRPAERGVLARRGTPGSIAPAPDTVYSPGPEWNKKYATLDIKQANELLDKVGLSKKDSEGYRLRTDGKGRLRLELVTVGGQFVPYTPVGEMIKQQWRKIGIDLDVKELERNLAFTRDNNSENQMITWANDGSEMIYLFPRHALPVDAAEAHMGMAYARWYASRGASGKKPEDPECSGRWICSAKRSARRKRSGSPTPRRSGASPSSRCGASERSASRRR
jgi:peptide/nickel transport system substrate-binding protein